MFAPYAVETSSPASGRRVAQEAALEAAKAEDAACEAQQVAQDADNAHAQDRDALSKAAEIAKADVDDPGSPMGVAQRDSVGALKRLETAVRTSALHAAPARAAAKAAAAAATAAAQAARGVTVATTVASVRAGLSAAIEARRRAESRLRDARRAHDAAVAARSEREREASAVSKAKQAATRAVERATVASLGAGDASSRAEAALAAEREELASLRARLDGRQENDVDVAAIMEDIQAQEASVKEVETAVRLLSLESRRRPSAQEAAEVTISSQFCKRVIVPCAETPVSLPLCFSCVLREHVAAF